MLSGKGKMELHIQSNYTVGLVALIAASDLLQYSGVAEIGVLQLHKLTEHHNFHDLSYPAV